jgi:acyl dehydratase
MTEVFHSATELLAAIGRKLGPSDWLVVDQLRIDRFADATGDHQWIHVDPQRAKQGPFGACIAHGYLTLSLVSLFLPKLIEVRGATMGVNYGLDRVRFPNIVPAGTRIRASGEIVAAEAVKGGAQITVRVTIEREGEARPACVADSISRFVFP